MAIGDISAITPVIVTPGTTAALVATVPSNEEWTFRFIRAVCLVSTGGTVPTISVGLTAAANEFCYNEFVPIPSASQVGAKNVVGPEFVTLPPSTPIYARASAGSAVRLTLTGVKKQVS